MKQNKKLSTFLSGVLAGAMLVACGTSAFAAAGGGSVRFNTVNMAINQKTVISAGDTLTTDAGCQIPSTITYTDELGRDTTYLPVRSFSEMLNIPVTWKSNTAWLGYGPPSSNDVTVSVGTGSNGSREENIWADVPLHRAGATAGTFTEVEPVWPANDKITCYLARDKYMSASFAVGGGTYYPYDEDGYFSVSVTNHTDRDLLLSVSYVATITDKEFPLTLVPAGQTVIRTFRAEAYTGGLYQLQPGFSFLLRDDMSQPNAMDTVSATVNIVSFDPNRTGAPLFS